MKDKLILFVKAPVPGRVKTRLVPPLSYSQAAHLYRGWAKEIYKKILSLPGVSAEVAYQAHEDIPTPQWLSETEGDVNFFLQSGNDLGQRMTQAFQSAFARGFEKVILLGSDSPGLPPAYIQEAQDSLDSRDCVLGPAKDGGYYLIGLRAQPGADIFRNVEWSTEKALKQTQANIQALGLTLHILPEYFDVDRPEDLETLSQAASPKKRVSIIIPVRNEEDLVAVQLQRLRSSLGSLSAEIIVVDGQSSDRTRERAQSLADKVLSCPVASRGAQMHLGAEKSSGELLLFLHADTQLPAHWPWFLEKTFLDRVTPPVGAAFDLDFDSKRFPFGMIATFARLRNKATGIPQGDQCLIVRRDAYFDSGGFPAAPLMEEYLFIPRLRRLGKIEIIREKVRTSVRKYERVGPFRNVLKNAATLCLFFAGVKPQKLAQWYRRGT